MTDDLRVELFVRSNRVGVRISGRVVLPKDIDPNTGQPSYVMIPGTGYENNERAAANRIGEPAAGDRTAGPRAPGVDATPGGCPGGLPRTRGREPLRWRGETEVFLDDLEISPFPRKRWPRSTRRTR